MERLHHPVDNSKKDYRIENFLKYIFLNVLDGFSIWTVHSIQQNFEQPKLHTSPMHWPIQKQWWSNRSTQLSHTEQCEQRGGQYIMHVLQYFTFIEKPLTNTSFVWGNRGVDVCLPLALTGTEES